MPSTTMTKKRKLSDLTVDDATSMLSSLETLLTSLDEVDEDLPPEFIPAIEKLRAKLEAIDFKVNASDVLAAKLQIGPLFLPLSDKRGEIEALGKADAVNIVLSFNVTMELIKLVRDHVSLETEAGYRVLINVILLRLASTMQSQESEVNIIPEYPLSKTIFEMVSDEQSFSGAVDYLLASVPPKFSRFVLDNPVAALNNPANMYEALTPTVVIIEAKNGRLDEALPQAMVAVTSYCKQHNLSLLRGCITSGERWQFFIYNGHANAGGQMFLSLRINLGPSLENLAFVLGLLKDSVENGLLYDQKYFSYF